MYCRLGVWVGMCAGISGGIEVDEAGRVSDEMGAAGFVPLSVGGMTYNASEHMTDGMRATRCARAPVCSVTDDWVRCMEDGVREAGFVQASAGDVASSTASCQMGWLCGVVRG